MNIIYICNEYPPGRTGGIGTFVHELANQLAHRGHKIFVVGFIDDVTQRLEIEDNNIKVIKLPKSSGKMAIFFDRLALYNEIKKLIFKNNIHIIEAPDFEGLSSFLPRGKYKSIVRLHGSHTYFAHEMNENPSLLIKFFEYIALKRTDYIISVSNYTAEKTKHLFNIKRKVTTIYNGIDIPNLSQCKDNWKTAEKIIFTGTLVEKKGVFALAKAWPLIKEELPNTHLIFIGKNAPYKEGLSSEDYIRNLSGNKNITFYGHIPKDEMQKIMVDCDIAIYPSFSETFGLAPIESMSLKIPTIYTKLSCGPEVMKHQDLIKVSVDPSNHKDIASKIISILKDKKHREYLANLGRYVVEKHYSNQNKATENEQFYRETLSHA